MIGWNDVETFSKYDLRKCGTDVYARNCEPILVSYAPDEDDVRIWECGQNPAEVIDFLNDSDRNVAHNAWFEFNVYFRAGWCKRPIEDWGCTMAQALAHSLPGKLDILGRQLGLPKEEQKLAEGSRLIGKFCKPQRGGNRVTKKEEPEGWDRFKVYSGSDTIAMRSSYHKMPRVNLDACGGL